MLVRRQLLCDYLLKTAILLLSPVHKKTSNIYKQAQLLPTIRLRCSLLVIVRFKFFVTSQFAILFKENMAFIHKLNIPFPYSIVCK